MESTYRLCRAVMRFEFPLLQPRKVSIVIEAKHQTGDVRLLVMLLSDDTERPKQKGGVHWKQLKHQLDAKEGSLTDSASSNACSTSPSRTRRAKTAATSRIRRTAVVIPRTRRKHCPWMACNRAAC